MTALYKEPLAIEHKVALVVHAQILKAHRKIRIVAKAAAAVLQHNANIVQVRLVGRPRFEVVQFHCICEHALARPDAGSSLPFFAAKGFRPLSFISVVTRTRRLAYDALLTVSSTSTVPSA